jgi:hypothetical protein
LKILLLDIDHTVSDAAWRDKMIGVYTWDEYHMEGAKDQPILDTIQLVKDLHSCAWTVIGLTARPEKWRKITMDWCVRHRVPLDELLMRPHNDFLPSPACKVKLVQERFGDDYSSIAMVLDDRLDVVTAFREIGIAAFQVFAKMSHKSHVDMDVAIAAQNLKERGI